MRFSRASGLAIPMRKRPCAPWASGDVIRTMQQAMRGEQRDLAVYEPGDSARTIVGGVVAEGLAGELRDRGNLVIDGVDGKAHYVALGARDELANYPAGAVVEVK